MSFQFPLIFHGFPEKFIFSGFSVIFHGRGNPVHNFLILLLSAVWQRREGVVFSTTLTADIEFSPYGFVVSSLDKALCDDYLC